MVEESLSRLTSFIKTWDMVAAENFDAPQTLSMYVASYDKILSLLQTGNSFRLRGKYLPAWTARGYLLELIFQRGFMEVGIDKAVSLKEFLRVNPDQHNHVGKLHRYFSRMDKKAPTTVSQFLARALGKAARKCNALTCSMWLCFGDDLGFCEEDFEESSDVWRAAASRYVSEHNVMPHPVVVAQSLRKNHALDSCE